MWYVLRFAVVCVILAAGVSQQARGDVTVEGWTIAIHGQITATDVPRVSAAISDPKTRFNSPMADYAVWLDSLGGDIDAAMAIGRILRKAGAATTVGSLDRKWVKETDSRSKVYGWVVEKSKPAVCASACVLVFCAGVYRVSGKLGIHRPYSTGGTTVSEGDARARYAANASRVKAYLEEIGMPARLYEDMMRVPADNVRWLTLQEQDEWGLLGEDPAWVDARDSRNAASWGLSKEEYFRRKARSDQECPFPNLPPYQRGQKVVGGQAYHQAVAVASECARAVFRGDR